MVGPLPQIGLAMNINPADFASYGTASLYPTGSGATRASHGDLTVIVDAIWRRRRLAAGIFVAWMAAALAYVLLATPQFTATTTVLIETKMTPPTPAQASSQAMVDPAVIDTQVELLQTGRIALDVIDRLGLARDPDFVDERPSLLGRLLALVAPARSGDAPADPRLIAMANFPKRVKVQRLGRSYIVEVSATTKDPRKSAAIVNAVADAYIQDQLGSGLENSQRSSDWMQRRLGEMRQRVDAAEAALKAFRDERPAVADGPAAARGTDPNVARLQDKVAAVVRARQALQGGLTTEAASLAAALDDAEANRLLQQARDAGTDASAAPTALVARLDQLEEERRRALAGAQLGVELRRGSAGSSTSAAPGTPAARGQELERAAETARSTYAALQNRVSRVSSFLQQQAIPVTEARVLTVATPPLGQSAPKTTVVLLLALVGGLAAGLVGAFVREFFDRRVRWPEQITRGLNLTFLGPIPRARRGWRILGRGAAGSLPVPLLIAGRGTSAAAVETLRTTKVLLDQATDRSRGRVVGVVSAVDHEGRATVAANLAALLADTRARVLLVDADLHDGTFSRSAAPDATDLATVLAEGRRLAASVVPLSLGFDFLPGAVAAVPPHPCELLASGEMRRLLAEARTAYDYVVVRVPAALCAVDVRALEDAIDAFVLTVASGETRLDELETALASCPALGRRLLGVILNRSALPARRAVRVQRFARLRGVIRPARRAA